MSKKTQRTLMFTALILVLAMASVLVYELVYARLGRRIELPPLYGRASASEEYDPDLLAPGILKIVDDKLSAALAVDADTSARLIASSYETPAARGEEGQRSESFLAPDQLAEVIGDEDIERIDVYPSASSPRVVPGTQTYPVVGIRDTMDKEPGATSVMELSLSIVNGYLDGISFSAPDSEARVSDDLPADSVPGTLHPEGLEQESDDAGYWSSFEIIDEEEQSTMLATWPAPDQLTFRTDGN